MSPLMSACIAVGSIVSRTFGAIVTLILVPCFLLAAFGIAAGQIEIDSKYVKILELKIFGTKGRIYRSYTKVG